MTDAVVGATGKHAWLVAERHDVLVTVTLSVLDADMRVAVAGDASAGGADAHFVRGVD